MQDAVEAVKLQGEQSAAGLEPGPGPAVFTRGTKVMHEGRLAEANGMMKVRFADDVVDP